MPSLDLSAKKLGPGSAAVVAAGVSVNAVLTELNLGNNNNIRAEGAAAIAEALRGNRVLKNIDLRGNSLGTEGWCAIFAALRDNKENKIESWDLSYQGINTEIVKVLAEYVSVSGVLTSLNVSHNDLTEEAALGIVRVERQRNKLTSLGLGRCGIGPTGAAEIAEYVSGSGVLTELKLDGHELDLPKLRGTDPVESLDLSSEYLGPASAIVIASLIAGNEVLKTLSLYRNNIRDEGAKELAAALRVNGVLIKLDISKNDIGPEGAKAMASALRVNAVLTDLNLSDNNLGGETDYIKASEVEGESKQIGAKVIYQGREMVVSQGVDSDGELKLVDVVQTGVLAIAKALEVNGVLKALYMQGNNLGDEGAKAIRDAVSGREEGFELYM